MNVLFVASVAVVAADPPQSRKLFIDALGLPLEGEGDGYYSSGSIPGSKHFGVWPLSEAAEACFWHTAVAGRPGWSPRRRSMSEVEDAGAVAAAGGELQRAGFGLLHPARTEPWGQTVATASHRGWPDRRHLLRSPVPRRSACLSAKTPRRPQAVRPALPGRGSATSLGRDQSSPENRSHADWRVIPSASPILVQVRPRSRACRDPGRLAAVPPGR